MIFNAKLTFKIFFITLRLEYCIFKGQFTNIKVWSEYRHGSQQYIQRDFSAFGFSSIIPAVCFWNSQVLYYCLLWLLMQFYEVPRINWEFEDCRQLGIIWGNFKENNPSPLILLTQCFAPFRSKIAWFPQ